MRVTVRRAKKLQGELVAPGDKSISHRALLFATLGSGTCEVRHLSPGADVRSTASCLRALGGELHASGETMLVKGVGLRGLHPALDTLDCGNSGTTMRLLAGVIAGSEVGGTLDGDASLRSRPMRRVTEPLREMGAAAMGVPGPSGREFAPLRIDIGRKLHGIDIALAISSAQVKSAILLAGLWAEGETRVREPSPSRDHTERMLRSLGVALRDEAGARVLTPPTRDWTMPAIFDVPGDPSSAAFVLAAAALVPDGEVRVRGVNTNPTRTGFLRALERMGASLTLEPMGERAGEPVADLVLRGGATLRAIHVEPSEIPSMVDEVPILSVLATQAQGTTEIRGAGELRVKESDRLAQIARGLTAMGARVEELPDGLRIDGPTPLHGATIDAARDHRIAMSFAVAGLCADGDTAVEGAEWADISFPGFFEALARWTNGAVDARGDWSGF
ncbi:MAG: 3-phosphoshikimate 1-carboxyvinyltransferase [Deltaproteobacteria bacterium]|nr:3-phosphoshikimate 1-carboxyvinyltransferase [Deltaproteobacteria bacterium]